MAKKRKNGDRKTATGKSNNAKKSTKPSAGRSQTEGNVNDGKQTKKASRKKLRILKELESPVGYDIFGFLPVHTTKADRKRAKEAAEALVAAEYAMDIDGIVEEIVSLILGISGDARLQWRKDGGVNVRVTRVVPDDPLRPQVVKGHRRQFRELLIERLKNNGWVLGDYMKYTFYPN